MNPTYQSKTTWSVVVRYLHRSYWKEYALVVRASHAGIAAARALGQLRRDGRIPKGAHVHRVVFTVSRLAPVMPAPADPESRDYAAKYAHAAGYQE